MLQLAWFGDDEFDPVDTTVVFMCYLTRPGGLWERPGSGQRISSALAYLRPITDGYANPVSKPHKHSHTDANRDADPNIDAYTIAFGTTGHAVAGRAADNL
jgi:hypothetical protein